jgi:hypothetical protein
MLPRLVRIFHGHSISAAVTALPVVSPKAVTLNTDVSPKAVYSYSQKHYYSRGSPSIAYPFASSKASLL